jgi:hypothetical protein
MPSNGAETLDEIRSLLSKTQALADTECIGPETVRKIIESLRLIKDRAQRLHVITVFETARKGPWRPKNT